MQLLCCWQVLAEQKEAESVAATIADEETEVAAKAAECEALKNEAAAQLVSNASTCRALCAGAWPI
jgi:hypothetical protein